MVVLELMRLMIPPTPANSHVRTLSACTHAHAQRRETGTVSLPLRAAVTRHHAGLRSRSPLRVRSRASVARRVFLCAARINRVVELRHVVVFLQAYRQVKLILSI